MIYEVTNFKVSPLNDKALDEIIKNNLHINKFKYRIIAKSIDARNKNDIMIVYKLLIDTNEKLKGKNINIYKEDKEELKYPCWKGLSPVIVGFGPAGMFSALYFARCKAKPIIIERGKKIEDRVHDVDEFLEKRVLNPDSNVQFGEGGAGAFSDGKLTTNLRNPLIKFILNEFYIHGAKEDVIYDAKPHVGTDYLRIVVKNIREEIIKLGGTFMFSHTYLKSSYDNGITTCQIKDNNTKEIKEIKTNHLLLALGHSARDTYETLYNDMHISMEQKAFSMGVRIEHKREDIDKAQYGKFYKYLPAAYYNLASHFNDRGVYTFCMCPGGYVLASTSDEGTIVVNGMSNEARENVNSNSALLVDVKPSDYNKTSSPLDGVYYQYEYEKKAFNLASGYYAPANLVEEFLNDKVAKKERSIKTSYPHGIKMVDLRECLPSYVIENLKLGIKEFDKKIHGFNNPDAILIGIESRSSSPLRIIRDKDTHMSSIKGIYPIGEGAGYAGGITSAALDGLKTAIMIGEENER